MQKKKVHEQVVEYSLEERNSVIVGGSKFFFFLFCSLVGYVLFVTAFFVLNIGEYINSANAAIIFYAIASIIILLSPFVWVKVKYPLYKEHRYHYIKAVKKKMKLMNRSFDNDDMYKTTVSEFPQPMEWYGSLVLCIMFIWVFVDFVYGIAYISGNIYGAISNMKITAEQMYEQYGTGLKVLDFLIGIVNIISAVLTVFAWKALKNLKKSAPKVITSVYAIGLISSIIYVLGWQLIGVDTALNNIPSLIANAAFLIGNSVYFKKRSAWFVH